MSLPQLPGTDIARFTIQFEDDADTPNVILNVFHMLSPDGWTVTQMQAVLEAMWGAYTDEWMPVATEHLTLVAGSYKDLTSLGNPTYQVADPSPVPGSETVQFSSVDCVTVTWTTDGGGRNRRGRTYLPGYPANGYAQADSAVWASGATTAAASWATAMIATGASKPGASGILCVASSYDVPKVRNTELTAHQITGATPRAGVSTQRRRRR